VSIEGDAMNATPNWRNMIQEQTHPLDPSNLSAFTGSTEFFRHSLRRDFLMTEGVHYVMQNGLAWFVDITMSVQHLPEIKAEPFQEWLLWQDTGISVICNDGNGNRIYRQDIADSDYPYEEFAMYVVDNGEGVTAMLPSEY
jgi:hypothetical protein